MRWGRGTLCHMVIAIHSRRGEWVRGRQEGARSPGTRRRRGLGAFGLSGAAGLTATLAVVGRATAGQARAAERVCHRAAAASAVPARAAAAVSAAAAALLPADGAAAVSAAATALLPADGAAAVSAAATALLPADGAAAVSAAATVLLAPVGGAAFGRATAWPGTAPAIRHAVRAAASPASPVPSASRIPA
jgi:hypothetical protein